MQQKQVKTIDWIKILFGLTVWVFLSLNAKAFNFAFYRILRWILPVLLVCLVLLKENGKIPYPPMIIVLFIFAVIPSFFVTIDIKESGAKAISFVLIVYSLFVCFWETKDKDELEDYFKIACVMILIFQTVNHIYCLMGLDQDGDRYNGFTTNANTLGIYSNLALWASYYFYVKTKTGGKQLFFVFMFIASIVLALLSGSRSAFVVILLNVIIVVFLRAKTNLAKWTVAFCIALFLVLLFTGALNFLEISALDRLLSEGGTSRNELWDYAIGIWKKQPIWGCGYRVSKYFNRLDGNENMDFHNSYLSLLIEIGIWGVVLIAIAIVATIISVCKYLKSKNNKKNDGFIPAIFMTISLFIGAWSESFLFSVGSTEAFVFWMLFVWVLNYLKKDEQKNKALNNFITNT